MKVAILLDLDNTLIYSDLQNDRLYVRPHVEYLIDVLSKYGSLNLCTLGTRTYAADILEKLNITDEFHHIYAREDLTYRNHMDCDILILIDNEEPFGPAITHKMDSFYCVNEPKRFHIHLPSFIGNPDDALIKVADDFVKLLKFI